MTLSIPLAATLHSYAADSSNQNNPTYEVSNSVSYEKDTLVVSDVKMYRAEQDVTNHFLTNLHTLLKQDDEHIITSIEYTSSLRISRLSTTRFYIDPYQSPEVAVNLKHEYQFVLLDWPMISDMTGFVYMDSAGDFPPPMGLNDYVEFQLSGAGTHITIQNYTNGSSPFAPGTPTTATTVTIAAFAAAYPNYILVRDDATSSFVSTLGGVWVEDQVMIKDAIMTIMFETGPVGNDTRFSTNVNYAPSAVMDGKNYTYNFAKVEAQYMLAVPAAYDCVALTGLVCATVSVDFYDNQHNLVNSIIDRPVDNTTDVRQATPEKPTTLVLYNPGVLIPTLVDGGFVKVTVKGSKTFVGGIHVGVSVDMGLTDFAFSTKFIDLSPTETLFGVVSYVEGLKVREYTGTFSFWTTAFDTHDKLLTALGGSTLIVNGSDTTDNLTPDSQDRFTATMMVGRVSSLGLNTVKQDDVLGEFAQAKFTIREQV